MNNIAGCCLALACGTVVALPVSASAAASESVLYSFCSQPDCEDGAEPPAGLIDVDGILYGVAQFGGEYNQPPGWGTLFSLDPATDTESTIHNFTGWKDGGEPQAQLISDNEGNLYGTAAIGGNPSSVCYSVQGDGTVFRMSPTGSETVLYNFLGGGDGCFPTGILVRDNQGNLYGTTQQGGGTGCSSIGAQGCGTVFRIAPDGTETVLYSFTGEADGALPGGNDLVLDRNGYLYGIAQHGGDTSCALGCGAAFRITPDGKMSVLHTFRGSRDGGVPTGIAAGRHGEFYVTTAQGGGSDCEFGCGTIFRISSKGAKSVFHEFQGSDGKEPVGGVLLDARGNMWVATYLGGAYGYGTVVELPSRGAEKVLHSFGGPDDSESPAGQLILENSILYGTTWAGGTGSCPCGTVFEITP